MLVRRAGRPRRRDGRPRRPPRVPVPLRPGRGHRQDGTGQLRLRTVRRVERRRVLPPVGGHAPGAAGRACTVGPVLARRRRAEARDGGPVRPVRPGRRQARREPGAVEEGRATEEGELPRPPYPGRAEGDRRGPRAGGDGGRGDGRAERPPGAVGAGERAGAESGTAPAGGQAARLGPERGLPRGPRRGVPRDDDRRGRGQHRHGHGRRGRRSGVEPRRGR
mmetsp:Transcript_4071/g.8402  ORF Transcript_4071/g.8402 Transcript_4071/m.8402 type:complete len:221 (-) Transcript_4071:962-1624(-)